MHFFLGALRVKYLESIKIINFQLDKTSCFYILSFQGQAGHLNICFAGPAQNLGALSDWAPVSLFPCFTKSEMLMTSDYLYPFVFICLQCIVLSCGLF